MRQTLQNNLNESHKPIVYSAMSVNNSGESGQNRKWPTVDNGQNDFSKVIPLCDSRGISSNESELRKKQEL